jgi:hypothetical protein
MLCWRGDEHPDHFGEALSRFLGPVAVAEQCTLKVLDHRAELGICSGIASLRDIKTRDPRR